MHRRDFLRPYKDRQMALIEAEINLLREPWQDPDTPQGEKDLIFHHAVNLLEKERRYRCWNCIKICAGYCIRERHFSD